MEINRAAFGALAVFGVVAAGSGAYLANRHSEVAMQPVRHIRPRPRARHRDGKQHHPRASSGRRDRAGRGGCSRARGSSPGPRDASRACAHDTSGIAARSVVVEFKRQRVFSGADVYTRRPPEKTRWRFNSTNNRARCDAGGVVRTGAGRAVRAGRGGARVIAAATGASSWRCGDAVFRLGDCARGRGRIRRHQLRCDPRYAGWRRDLAASRRDNPKTSGTNAALDFRG